MPVVTYPNQRTVVVHRVPVKYDFLGIKNENWQAAARNMSPHTLLLYLYLASNANNFELALSPAAVRAAVGMARSTYHDQFHILEDKGYLVLRGGNKYDFYETPQLTSKKPGENSELADGQDFENNPADGIAIHFPGQNRPSDNIEINK